MAYVWINPVAAGMYKQDILNDFLRRHDHVRVEATNDWLSVVKEKYRSAVCQTTDTVVDMRCPKIKKLLEEIGIINNVTIPDILPILIHCGQELSEREDLLGEEKIITTPCQALADMGNELGMKDTWFIPWNRFVELLDDEPGGVVPEESPIPPGFFEELSMNTISITGEEEIRNYFENNMLDNMRIVELLYCKEGCHNGDGIRRCEV